MFSRDAFSYLAQGALLRDGFDPYEVGPVVNPGILLDNVSNVWTTTTTPYGPVHLLLTDAIVSLTGDNVIAGTMLLRITMLPGLALMMWGVPISRANSAETRRLPCGSQSSIPSS